MAIMNAAAERNKLYNKLQLSSLYQNSTHTPEEFVSKGDLEHPWINSAPYGHMDQVQIAFPTNAPTQEQASNSGYIYIYIYIPACYWL